MKDLGSREEGIQPFQVVPHRVVRLQPQQGLHSGIPEKAVQALVEDDDALVADVIDHQIRQLLLLTQETLGLLGLLHASEEAQQQERRADHDAGDEG
jgi:hypothetical protein